MYTYKVVVTDTRCC